MKTSLTSTFLMTFVLMSSYFFGQHTEPREKYKIKNETDAINLFFRADSIDIFITPKICLDGQNKSIINIRKLKGGQTIAYSGGQPNKTFKGNATKKTIRKVKAVLLPLLQQPYHIDESPYSQIYLRTCDSSSHYSDIIIIDHSQLADKKIRNILGLK